MKSVSKKGLIFAYEYAVSMPIYFYSVMDIYNWRDLCFISIIYNLMSMTDINSRLTIRLNSD